MQINPKELYDFLSSQGIEFFTGVPDSLLKEFCLCVNENVSTNNHIITANEGNAIALAAGYHLSTETIPLVYLQNSGLGNAINPLLSLCDEDVYSIPMLLMIGWRGEPGVKDEPQHVKQGKIQIDLLESMNISYEIISDNDPKAIDKSLSLINLAKAKSKPVVLLVKKGTFENYSKAKLNNIKNQFLREEALEIILNNVNKDTIIISTTGKTSREIFEIREKRGESHKRDFLTVGSMGHSSSIALGIALAKPDRKVICVDGDGSMLMHLGSLSTLGSIKPKNFNHILLNNEVHESVGGQKTAAKEMNLSSIAKSMGYRKLFFADTKIELQSIIKPFLESVNLSFLEVKINPGSRKNLGRPTIRPVENKIQFIEFLKD
jgi:phosphonopyruvate decarboxylase